MTDEQQRPPERSIDELLERYWDELVGGEPAGPDIDELDPSLARTIWRLNALHDAPPIDQRHKQQLWEELMHGSAQSIPLRGRPSSIAVNGRANGHVGAPTWRPAPAPAHGDSRHRVRHALSTLGIVALVLISLIAVYFIARQDQPAVIPPLQDTATPLPAPPPEEWPMYRGNPGRTGNLPVTGPSGTPVELWRYQTQGRIDAVPVIVAGVLYVASEDGNLYAMNSETGALIWQAPLGAGSGSSVVVADGVVYVSDNNLAMQAFDATTGQPRWKVDGAGVTDPGPVVNGTAFGGGNDGTFQAIQTGAGEVVWRTPLGGGPSRAAAYADGRVFMGSGDGRVNALDAATGALQWSYDLGTGTVTTVVVADGVVYGTIFGGAANAIVALNATTGQQRWIFNTATASDLRSPAIGNGLVYTVSNDGNVYAIDITTGDEVWSAPAGNTITASPALAGDTLYVVSHNGDLIAFDAATGAERWRVTYESTSDYGPIVANGKVYLATDAGYVIAFGDGSGGPVEATPATGTGSDSGPSPTASPAARTSTTANSLDVVATITGGPNLPFNGPEGIAFDAQGNVYIMDTRNDRIQIFDANGTFIKTFGETGSGPGQFRFHDSGSFFAADIAIASDGSIFVADPLNFRIQKFDANWQFIAEWGTQGKGDSQFDWPFAVALDPSGNLYVADYNNHRVQEFDPNGTFLRALGGFGSDLGKMNAPSGVAVAADGTLYVAEAGNNRLQRFDASGVPLNAVGQFGSGPGDLSTPSDVAVAPNGIVVVSEYTGNRLHVYSPEGATLAVHADAGPNFGAFKAPTYLQFDPTGEFLYVSEEVNQRVLKIRLSSMLLSGDTATESTPVATSATPTSDATPDASAAQSTAQVEFVWATTGGPETPFLYPSMVAIGPDGRLWVVDGANSRIQIFTTDGVFQEVWGTLGSGDGEFDFRRVNYGDGIGGIAFAADGTIYIVDTGNFRVQQFDTNRQFLSTWGSKGAGESQFIEPTAIEVAPDGRIYVVDDQRDDVQVFSPDGTYFFTFAGHGSGNGQLSFASFLTFAPNGNLWIGDPYNHRVEEFTVEGEFVSTFGMAGTGEGQFNQPQQVAFDGRGHVYVTDFFNNRIQVFDEQWNFLTQWGEFGSGDGQLSGPAVVTFDDAGNIYVTDVFNHRVQKFRVTMAEITV